jgi:hypothetical protein
MFNGFNIKIITLCSPQLNNVLQYNIVIVQIINNDENPKKTVHTSATLRIKCYRTVSDMSCNNNSNNSKLIIIIMTYKSNFRYYFYNYFRHFLKNINK